MKKRISVLLLIMTAMFVLVGWGKKEVRLLDSSKLIDLNKAIELAKPGGMSGDSEEDTDRLPEIDEAEEDNAGSENDNDSVHDSLNAAASNIVISIRDKQISYTNSAIHNDNITVAQLRSRIQKDYTSKAQITLMDDFAESHVYNDVLKVLNELKSDIGLTYKEEQSAGGE